jgi:hypothetical protein
MTLTASPLSADDTTTAEPMVWVTFSLPLAGREELKDHAHLARISLSELVRRRVLGLPEPRAAVPTVNSQVYSELGRVGNNLNQLTKLSHESGQLAPAQVQTLGLALSQLKALLVQVQSDVIGAAEDPSV